MEQKYKILVDSPSGEQEIVEVLASGDYNDKSRVVWDERVDGPLPVMPIGGLERVGNSLVENPDKKEAHDEMIDAKEADQEAIDTKREANRARIGVLIDLMKTQKASIEDIQEFLVRERGGS